MFEIVLPALMEGFVETLKLFALTLLGAIPLGLIIAFGSMSRFQPLNKLVRMIVWVVRGTPLMLQLLVIYYGPGLILDNNIWGVGNEGRFIAVIVAFIINYSCYFSVIYRGGIESISSGQYEAGKVLGMTRSQTFFKVILLQVIKRIVPPMSNEIITLVKDTSLASNITVLEMFMATRRVVSTTYEPLALYIEVGFVYLMFSTLLNWLQRLGEKKLNASVGLEVGKHA